MPKNINIPKNFENTYLIFYSMKKNSVKEVLWFKLIQPAKNKNGELLNFYAVPSSKYGIRIPKTATHWCIAVLGGEKADVLLEDKISEPMIKNEYHLFDETYVHMHRYAANCKFMIGSSSEVYRKRKPKNKVQSEALNRISELLN